MRVVIVAPGDLPVPPAQGGSVQIYLDAVCRELGQRGACDIVLLSPAGGEGSYQGVSHIPIAVRGSAYRRQVLQTLRRLAPDIVQVENRPSFVPSVRCACPAANVIVNLHSTTFLGPKHVARAKVKHILRQADAVIVNSHCLKSVVEKRFALKESGWNPVVIHPGVHTSAFAQGRVSGPRATQAPLRMLYLGRVIRQKGVHVLIEAVRQLHRRGVKVCLTVVGHTHPWERTYLLKLHNMARNLPVRFRGFVAPAKLPGLFARHDVLVCPSQGLEAFGLVNLEALSAGLPVVASKQGGIPEIVTGDCGILVDDYRNPGAFATALEQLVNNADVFAQLAMGTKKRAALFTWTRTAYKIQRLYKTLSRSAH